MNRHAAGWRGLLRWDLGTSALATVLIVVSAVRGWPTLGTDLAENLRTVLVAAAAIVVGELTRIVLPSGRIAAPIASAASFALVFIGTVQGERPLLVDWSLIVLVCAVGVALGVLIRAVVGYGRDVALVGARLLGIGVACMLTRAWSPGGTSLLELGQRPQTPSWILALAMICAAAVGAFTEFLLGSLVRSSRRGEPTSTALRHELVEVLPLTAAVVATSPIVALVAPIIGLASIPLALFPMMITAVAVRRYAAAQQTYRETILTLARLTDEGGYTATAHAERVAAWAVLMGRQLGLGPREQRDLEYAALLHDLGQLSLHQPIPRGATVLLSADDQRRIAHEGARILRVNEALAGVADYVEGQATPFRQVRELGEDVPLASRIIKVANAFDDFSEGDSAPRPRSVALERMHLGLGYEYDPEVVDALATSLGSTAEPVPGDSARGG